MSKTFKALFVTIVLIIMTNCEQDPCEVDHTIIDGECIPDYIFPPNNIASGERFYHKVHGVILFKDGLWYNSKNQIIYNLETD